MWLLVLCVVFLYLVVCDFCVFYLFLCLWGGFFRLFVFCLGLVLCCLSILSGVVLMGV